MQKIGIYIHIPFCRGKCPYCDFYSCRAGEEDFDNYVTALKTYIKAWAEKIGAAADTLYIGGGTPSVIGADRLCKIIKCVDKNFGAADEVTVECNPSLKEKDFFKKINSVGVNRISLGMQSANDGERRALGRIAGVADVDSCISQSIAGGIDNISLDVMLGIPNQTEKSLKETLRYCVSSGAKHISAYMLKIEEGTLFYKKQNTLPLPSDDLTADFYLQTVDSLARGGFKQYEISNFAVPGYESRHNLKYWNCEDYLGIGPSAHSFLGGKRFYYGRNLIAFENVCEPVQDGTGGDLQEYIMLRLRLCEGFVFDEIKDRFAGFDIAKFEPLFSEFVKAGYAEADNKSFRLTAKGFLISNMIITEILSRI